MKTRHRLRGTLLLVALLVAPHAALAQDAAQYLDDFNTGFSGIGLSNGFFFSFVLPA